MRVLSIDPGYTTGIAIYDGEGNLEYAMSVTLKGLHRNGFFNHLISMARPDITLIEDLPTNNVTPTMRATHSHITQWFHIASYPVEIIRPSQWKGLIHRVEIPGQHARDAATMAAWWLKKKGILVNDGQDERVKE